MLRNNRIGVFFKPVVGQDRSDHATPGPVRRGLDPPIATISHRGLMITDP